jgi:hypothetical protein
VTVLRWNRPEANLWCAPILGPATVFRIRRVGNKYVLRLTVGVRDITTAPTLIEAQQKPLISWPGKPPALQSRATL